VIGGDECNINESPFLAFLYSQLLSSRRYFCGMTLINQEWVLTAAHCNLYPDRKDMNWWLLIKLGKHSGSTRRWVANYDEQVRYWPKEKFIWWYCPNKKKDVINNYVWVWWDKDILLWELWMLIRLNRPVKYSEHIAPLSLPSSPPSAKWWHVGSVCRIMGWGQITETWWNSEDTLPDVPRCANINLFNYEVCRAYNQRWWRGLPAKTLCAGDLEGIIRGGWDTCVGDSGGPLICDGQYQGIAYWGSKPCAEPDEPAAYSKVFDHLDWSQSVIAGGTWWRGDDTCP
uniref:Thrombin-like enzyme TLBm n=1 Tax=Bothrops marajoensis TaxID=157554 RepID=VSP1_BOTMA|nr:RecName: Full=Thrombin-like enzyme TLBm; Short=SVTLE TLBm; AltName: Full=Fibrinogen-clotting enzyme; AltName: Full=Snake venom serine protease; Short=SVSP [Bothrops marajoensis]